MSDSTPTDSGDPHADRADAHRERSVELPTAGTPPLPEDPAARARHLLAATGFLLARLVFVTAVPLATLCVLVGVEALVGSVPRVVLTTAGGEYALTVTQALAFVVAAHLTRRLYALNTG